MSTRFSIVFLLFFVTLSSNSQTSKTDILKVGITSSLNKVFQTIPFNFQGYYKNQTEIELALNEYEATQVVLFPETDLTGITIQAGPLAHENKTDALPPKSIQINPIGYVNLKGGKKTQGRTGFHPDILLPNQSFKLRNGIPQPVLVTVYAPSDAKPGSYQTELTIKKDNKPIKILQLNVLIHPILIPKQRQFKSLSITKSSNYAKLWPKNQGFNKLTHLQESYIFKNIAEIGFRNHLPPTGFLVNGLVSYNLRKKDEGKTYTSYPTHNRKTGEFDAERTDEYIDYMQSKNANSFFIGITSDIYKYEHNSKEREEILLEYLDDIIPHLKKRGVLDQSYLYNIDEPWGDAVEHAKKIYRLVKQRYGYDIHVMQNTNQNNDRILENLNNHFQAIDINLGFYNITKLQSYREKYPANFQDVWWNVNYWPRTRPNLFLEYPLIDARIIGPMSFRFDIQGFEYWELVYVNKIENYRPVKPDDFQLDWIVGKNSLDGLLLYPNENHDFYSSMRFESFRDGMEDLELIYLLRKLDSNNSLLDISIINDIDNYIESNEQYMDYRNHLFAEIKRLI